MSELALVILAIVIILTAIYDYFISWGMVEKYKEMADDKIRLYIDLFYKFKRAEEKVVKLENELDKIRTEHYNIPKRVRDYYNDQIQVGVNE